MREVIGHYLVIFFLLLVYFSDCVEGRPKECLYYRGKCIDHCPMGMYPYHTRCDRDTISQRTCIYPEQYPLGFTCGWSRCDCNGDLVMSDIEDEPCVPVSDCRFPKYRPNKKKKRKRKGKNYGRLKDSDDLDEVHRGLEPVHNMGDFNPVEMFVPGEKKQNPPGI